MQLIDFQPHWQLKHLIKGYWLLESDQVDKIGISKTLFPLGAIEIIIHLNSPFQRLRNDSWVTEEKAFVEGQQSGTIIVRQQGPLKTVGITLYPWALLYFYNLLPSTLTDCKATIEILGKPMESLQSALTICQDFKGIEEHCNKYFLDLLYKSNTFLNDADRLFIQLISRHSLENTLQELRNEWTFSARYFEKKCIHLTGLSPGETVQKRRMKNALDMCRSTSFRSFTDVAHAAGYYDQAHFTKEFKYYFGNSPRHVFKDNNYFLEMFF